MTLKNIDKFHPAFGLISINTFQGGAEKLFGQAKTNKSAVTMDFETADLNSSFREELKLSHGKLISRIDMTSEQWSSLLLNKDSENGVPVTIRFDRKQGSIDGYNIKENGEADDNLVKYKKAVLEHFKKVPLTEKIVKELLTKEKLLAADKKEIKKLFKEVTTLISEDKEFLINSVNNFVQEVERVSEANFVKGIKENLLNIKDVALIEDKSTETIIEAYQGILVLRTLHDTKNTLVKDYDANSGVSITLYRAKVVVNGDIKSIQKTDEVLVEVKMSSTQFSELITSFGRANIPCTLSVLNNEDIEVFPHNINDEVEDMENLYKFVDKIDSEIEDCEKELDELLSKSISKEKRRQIGFSFEKISRLTGSNLMFYSKNVFDSGIKYSIRRQQDVQSSMMNGIYKEGLVKFQNDMKLLGGKEGAKLLEQLTLK